MKMRWISACVLTLILAACSREAERTASETATATPPAAGTFTDIAVPVGRDDPALRERERFNDDWRGLEGFGSIQARQRAARAAAAIQFAPNGAESFDGQGAATIDAAPVVVPIKGDVSGPTVLRTQVYLDRLGFSVGALDGRWGRNTAIALWWYQRSRGVEAAEPGALDEATYRELFGEAEGAKSIVERTLGPGDVEGPFTPIPDDVYEQEKLDCLCYETLAEKLAERFHTTVGLLERLNPGRDLATVGAGDRIFVPNVREAGANLPKDIARVVISIKGNTFNAFDAAGNLIFHAPTTLGSKYDPSPRETLEVKKVAFDPHFHYQPKLFHEVPDDEPEANLNPGPNSPVGVVWIALTKPHYGIHGTSDPESIGYASSHGCVRLTNWDAREVGSRIGEGVKIEFVDTASAGTTSR